MSLYCKTDVMFGYHFRKCSRKAVRDGFCKQHHPDSIAARDKASEEKYAEQRYNSPLARLARANKQIKELEERLDECKQCCNRKDSEIFRMGLQIKRLKVAIEGQSDDRTD